MYYVRQGVVELRYRGSSATRLGSSSAGELLSTVGQGEYFGMVVLMCQCPRPCAADARTTVALLAVDLNVIIDVAYTYHSG